MTAPFTGAADVPDVAASPMPVAAILAIKIVRMVTSPSINNSPIGFPERTNGARWLA
jgi:hypothetical protein